MLDENFVDEAVVHHFALGHGESLYPRQPCDDPPRAGAYYHVENLVGLAPAQGLCVVDRSRREGGGEGVRGRQGRRGGRDIKISTSTPNSKSHFQYRFVVSTSISISVPMSKPQRSVPTSNSMFNPYASPQISINKSTKSRLPISTPNLKPQKLKTQ